MSLNYPRHMLSLAAGLLLVALAFPVHADSLQDASLLLKQGQKPQALDKIDQYLAGKPKDAQGRFLRGLILTEMGRTSEAITVFTKLTEDYPELPEPYNNLAVIYAQQTNYEKAKQSLEMAIRTHPSYATAHENLGDIYAQLASQAYDKALQIDSGNASAQTKLAMIRDLMGSAGRPGTARPAGKTSGAASATPPAKPLEEKTVVAAAPKTVATAPKPPAPVATAPTPAVPVAAAPIAAAKPAVDLAGNEIAKSLDAWAAAWSKKNVKAYLAFYAKNFQTPGGSSRASWEAERAQRINKPGGIQVDIENPKVSQDGPDHVTVRFRQHYRSASLKTSSNKVMVLVRNEGRWLIQQERVGK